MPLRRSSSSATTTTSTTTTTTKSVQNGETEVSHRKPTEKVSEQLANDNNDADFMDSLRCRRRRRFFLAVDRVMMPPWV